MACKGKCQVQLNDIDMEDVEFKHGDKQPAGCPSVPDEAMDQIREFLQPYFVKTWACEDAGCDCVPVDENPKWSDWQEYDAEDVIKKFGGAVVQMKDKSGNSIECKYKIRGKFYVSSAVVEGVCMKQSDSVWDRRMRSNRPKWWKKKNEAK